MTANNLPFQFHMNIYKQIQFQGKKLFSKYSPRTCIISFHKVSSRVVICTRYFSHTCCCFSAFLPSHSHDFIGDFTTSYRELARGQSQFNVYEVSHPSHATLQRSGVPKHRVSWIPFLTRGAFLSPTSLVSNFSGTFF